MRVADRRCMIMTVSYNKLWKLLIDKRMSKADLRRATGISPNTMTKMNQDEEVALSVLGKICNALNCDVGDVVEFVSECEEERNREGY
jgi:DNA-binding Xre family transcriptional regulator